MSDTDTAVDDEWAELSADELRSTLRDKDEQLGCVRVPPPPRTDQPLIATHSALNRLRVCAVAVGTAQSRR